MQKKQLPEVIVNGYAYPTIRPEVLSQTAPNLTFLSIFHYDLSEDGHLIDVNDSLLLSELSKYPVAPLMVITAISETDGFQKDIMANVLQSPELQANLISDIVRIIREKNLMGVDYDFEYVYPQYKEEYAALIAQTRKILNPMGYIVTATVAPKTSSDQQGLLYEGHDYRLIGKAANLVLVMTYEWGYTYGPRKVIKNTHYCFS